MSAKVLFIDDDASILAAYQRNLRKQFSIDVALGGVPGLAAIATHGPYAVVVADMQMPGMNGVEFLTRAEAVAPETVRIMLTGNADQKTASDAVNQGHVFRFLNKPCPPEVITLTLTAAVRQYRLITAERELLENTLNGSIKLLTDILSMVDPQSFGRAKLLRDYMKTYLAPMPTPTAWEFEIAAMVASIGLVTVPPTVLRKARGGLALTGAEKDILARVPQTGSDLLANIPRLETVARIVRFQAKHFDGSGWPPEALAGDEIPVASRILKVLSDLLELEAEGQPRSQALKQMQTRTGWYDPQVLDAAFACFDIYLPATSQTTAPIRAITVQELRTKDSLAADLLTCDGTLVACAGTEISQLILTKIHNFHDLAGLQQPIHVFA